MINFRQNFKKFVTSAPFFLILVFLILVIKFHGLFQDGFLPGWDTMPRQYTLRVLAKDFLPKLKLTSGYDLNWFGGFPTFHFYPPLVLILISTVHFLSLKSISLFLSYRIFTFLSLFFFDVALYLFTKEFLNKKAAKASILFGLFLIFYCYVLLKDQAWYIGAGATIFMGLLTSGWGLVLFLLYFVFLEKLRKEPNKNNFLITAIILTCLFLSHIFSTVVAGIFLFIYLLFHHQKKILKNAILTGLIAVCLSGFYFIPFIAGLKYTSTEVLRLWDPVFYVFFPFKPSLSFTNFLPFLIFILFIVGSVVLYRKQRIFLPVAIIIVFIFLFGDYLPEIFPNLNFHYMRFVQFFLAIILSISSYGFVHLMEKFREKGYLKYSFFVLVVSTFGWTILKYDDSYLSRFSSQSDWPSCYHYRLDEYPQAESAKKVTEYFNKINPPERIFAESPSWLAEEIGSGHYFTAVLALNGQKVINGLPVESVIQNVFIMPLFAQISDNMTWGLRPLQWDQSFNTQPPESMLDRLKIFNVGYIIAYSDKLKNNLRDYQDAELLETFGNFQIYRLKNPRDLVYQPEYKPGLFINQGGGIGFRDFAQWWYKFPPLLDFPIAESVSRIEKLDKEEIDNFSMIIISAKKLNQKQRKILEEFGHPTIWLTNQKNVSESVLLPQFDLDDSQGSMSLAALLLNEKKKYPHFASNINIDEFADEKLLFNASGPTIVNLGYFPYWQSVNKNQKVYQVTPGQMLVFTDGETILEYRSDWLKKVSIVISWLTLLGLIGWGIRNEKLKNKTDKRGNNTKN